MNILVYKAFLSVFYIISLGQIPRNWITGLKVWTFLRLLIHNAKWLFQSGFYQFILPVAIWESDFFYHIFGYSILKTKQVVSMIQ